MTYKRTTREEPKRKYRKSDVEEYSEPETTSSSKNTGGNNSYH
jgi:hypothetical protein